MTRAEVYVQVAAALYAAHRTDPHPSSIEKDVGRTRESARQAVDMIMAEVAEIEREDAGAQAAKDAPHEWVPRAIRDVEVCKGCGRSRADHDARQPEAAKKAKR